MTTTNKDKDQVMVSSAAEWLTKAAKEQPPSELRRALTSIGKMNRRYLTPAGAYLTFLAHAPAADEDGHLKLRECAITMAARDCRLAQKTLDNFDDLTATQRGGLEDYLTQVTDYADAIRTELNAMTTRWERIW